MTAATPSPAARSPYGDLAEDVALLASDGKVIQRHDGMYRLNGATEKLTAAQVRGMAAELRNRRLAARYAPAMKAGHEIVSGSGPDNSRARMARHEIVKTREGTPAGDGAGTPVEGRAGSTIANLTCTKCGGPRSKWSKGLCVGCYTPAGCPPSPKPPTADRPDKFWRAVERDAAPTGRADVAPSPDVPPGSTPQTVGASSPSVTPAPESGASAGTISDALTANPLGAYCGCGALRSHTGRCWHRRGLRAPGPIVPERRRSKVSRDANITALWAEVDALKSSNARLEKAVGELRALMSMEGLR